MQQYLQTWYASRRESGGRERLSLQTGLEEWTWHYNHGLGPADDRRCQGRCRALSSFHWRVSAPQHLAQGFSVFLTGLEPMSPLTLEQALLAMVPPCVLREPVHCFGTPKGSVYAMQVADELSLLSLAMNFHGQLMASYPNGKGGQHCRVKLNVLSWLDQELTKENGCPMNADNATGWEVFLSWAQAMDRPWVRHWPCMRFSFQKENWPGHAGFFAGQRDWSEISRAMWSVPVYTQLFKEEPKAWLRWKPAAGVGFGSSGSAGHGSSAPAGRAPLLVRAPVAAAAAGRASPLAHAPNAAAPTGPSAANRDQGQQSEDWQRWDWQAWGWQPWGSQSWGSQPWPEPQPWHRQHAPWVQEQEACRGPAPDVPASSDGPHVPASRQPGPAPEPDFETLTLSDVVQITGGEYAGYTGQSQTGICVTPRSSRSRSTADTCLHFWPWFGDVTLDRC